MCRCWLQEPPHVRERQPLVPLGLCPGEHTVSAWGVEVPSSGSSRSGIGGDDDGTFSSATPTSFAIHSSETTETSTAGRYSSVVGGVEGNGSGGENGDGIDSGSNDAASGGKHVCDGSERQPALPGRENQLRGRHGGGLCRVCSHTLEEEGRHDGESFHFSLTSSVLPQGRKRLMLRNSFIAKFAGGGGGHAAAEGGGQSEQSYEPAPEERKIEWPIDLREGDSPAAAAREFVTERLGLAARPKGTAPEVVQGVSVASLARGGGQRGEESAQTAQEAVGGATAAKGEQMAIWLTKLLEIELAERQVRGGMNELCGKLIVRFDTSRRSQPTLAMC